MIIEKNYFIDSEFLPLGHSPVISGSSDKWQGAGKTPSSVLPG